MRPREIQPTEECRSLLTGADFADAFVMDLPAGLAAPEVAERVFAGMPVWVRGLMALRNMAASQVGLKTDGGHSGPGFGMFPILLATQQRLVLGFDDRHLDFRIVLDVVPLGLGNRVTLTTLVRRHIPLAWWYLAVVMPFHKRIVPAVLARVARR